MTAPRKPANDIAAPTPKRRVVAAFDSALPIMDEELRLYETHCAALIQRLTGSVANDRLHGRAKKESDDAGGDLRAGIDDAASGE